MSKWNQYVSVEIPSCDVPSCGFDMGEGDECLLPRDHVGPHS